MSSDFPQKPTIDAVALIRARANKRKPKIFEECVAFYRGAGYSDAEIARAMADSPCLVDALGREARR
jgi:hypothetical protein